MSDGLDKILTKQMKHANNATRSAIAGLKGTDVALKSKLGAITNNIWNGVSSKGGLKKALTDTGSKIVNAPSNAIKWIKKTGSSALEKVGKVTQRFKTAPSDDVIADGNSIIWDTTKNIFRNSERAPLVYE